MNSAPHESLQLCLIGDATRREFRRLATWLIGCQSRCAVRTFSSIPEALAHHSFADAAPDLTIVLQSSSEQYAHRDVDSLIGRTLFSRLLCCYGAWCESDGRNQSIWPDAVRVPVRLAESVIESEFRRIFAEAEPIPVTAARDEVFAHRLGVASDWVALNGLELMNGAIVGPDRVFRKTLSMALRELGLRTLHMPLLTARQPPRAKESSRGPIHIVLHDLDPWSSSVEKSVLACRHMFPAAIVLGMATMPDAGLELELADTELHGVIPKLDIEHGLRWHLNTLLNGHTFAAAAASTESS